MRLAHPLVLVVLSAGLLATAPARADTGVFSVGSFSAPYSGGGLHVQFTLVSGLGIYGWTGYDWSATPVVVDVWRRKMADPCTAQIHVAFLPWVNQLNTPFVTADIVDATVDPNATYQYFVYGIDAQGGRIEPAVMLGAASTGIGILSLASLSYVADCGISAILRAISCYNSCDGWLFISSAPPEAAAYYNTTITLAIYGEVDGLSPSFCNIVEPAYKITSIVEESCVTAIRPASWGAVKAMYR